LISPTSLDFISVAKSGNCRFLAELQVTPNMRSIPCIMQILHVHRIAIILIKRQNQEGTA